MHRYLIDTTHPSAKWRFGQRVEVYHGGRWQTAIVGQWHDLNEEEQRAMRHGWWKVPCTSNRRIVVRLDAPCSSCVLVLAKDIRECHRVVVPARKRRPARR